MRYVALFVVAMAGSFVRGWYRNTPLRREMRTRPITFRTDQVWVRFPASPWRESGTAVRGMELIIRGDMFRVGAPFGLGLNYYFRAAETTIELSRNPLRIYGLTGRREWIVVRGRQLDREVRLAMTKRYFLEDVWNALLGAGAVPTSAGPTPRDGRNRL